MEYANDLISLHDCLKESKLYKIMENVGLKEGRYNELTMNNNPFHVF